MLSADYLVGFTDGEGSFSINIYNLSRAANRKNRSRRRSLLGIMIVPVFTIVNNDKRILEEIKDFFGFGTIYTHGNPSFSYEVNTLDKALKIRSFFENHPLKVKKENFIKWCECLDLLNDAPRSAPNHPRLTEELLLKIAKLREEINPTRHKHLKWTYEKIQKLLQEKRSIA